MITIANCYFHPSVLFIIHTVRGRGSLICFLVRWSSTMLVSPQLLYDFSRRLLHDQRLSFEAPDGAPPIPPRANFYPLDAHRCDHHPTAMVLPTFLVTSLREVPSVDAMRNYVSPRLHDTYWVAGALLTHFGWQHPNSKYFRNATLRELVCALAHFPAVGSFRTWDNAETRRPAIEACLWRGRPSLHRTSPSDFYWPGLDHHRLWIPIDTVPECSSTRDLVLGSR